MGQGLRGLPAVPAAAPAGLGQEEGGRGGEGAGGRGPHAGDQGQTHTVARPGKQLLVLMIRLCPVPALCLVGQCSSINRSEPTTLPTGLYRVPLGLGSEGL